MSKLPRYTSTLALAQARHVSSISQGNGQVTMPLGKTFFAPSYGMLADRFGVNWRVIAEQRA